MPNPFFVLKKPIKNPSRDEKSSLFFAQRKHGLTVIFSKYRINESVFTKLSFNSRTIAVNPLLFQKWHYIIGLVGILDP